MNIEQVSSLEEEVNMSTSPEEALLVCLVEDMETLPKDEDPDKNLVISPSETYLAISNTEKSTVSFYVTIVETLIT